MKKLTLLFLLVTSVAMGQQKKPKNPYSGFVAGGACIVFGSVVGMIGDNSKLYLTGDPLTWDSQTAAYNQRKTTLSIVKGGLFTLGGICIISSGIKLGKVKVTETKKGDVTASIGFNSIAITF